MSTPNNKFNFREFWDHYQHLLEALEWFHSKGPDSENSEFLSWVQKYGNDAASGARITSAFNVIYTLLIFPFFS
jgi:hypothetical protein